MRHPTVVAAVAAVASLSTALLAPPALAAEAPAPDGQPKIQIAILLDTSSSMDGLINQTRAQLWRIVNTFATAKRHGKSPRLEIALYQYGNNGLSRESGFIQRMVPLTTDLDRVSEALFKLTTNGGDEYCGQVIHQALGQLEWSKNRGDLKLVYIAGNEPFTQGPVNYKAAVKDAISSGVVVNTIHAGSEREGIDGKWKDAAMLADGNFITIDQNRAVAQVDAPMDQEIARLNEALNATYVGYGSEGGRAKERQVAQDKNATGMSPSSLATRAVSKSSGFYDNSGWDLVDAKKKGQAVAEEALPAELKKMTKDDREKLVDAKAKERTEIQAKIATLAQEREQYVQAELKKQATASSKGSGLKTMDDALIESAKAQAAKQAFSF